MRKDVFLLCHKIFHHNAIIQIVCLKPPPPQNKITYDRIPKGNFIHILLLSCHWNGGEWIV